MLGAIIGDGMGSEYKFDNAKDYYFHMLTKPASFLATR